MSWFNTLLAKHEDDEAPLIHWNEIDNQPRDESGFQNRILAKQRHSSRMSHSTLSSSEQERKRRKCDQSREKERFFCS